MKITFTKIDQRVSVDHRTPQMTFPILNVRHPYNSVSIIALHSDDEYFRGLQITVSSVYRCAKINK